MSPQGLSIGEDQRTEITFVALFVSPLMFIQVFSSSEALAANRTLEWSFRDIFGDSFINSLVSLYR